VGVYLRVCAEVHLLTLPTVTGGDLTPCTTPFKGWNKFRAEAQMSNLSIQ
jgi:hypothetical protein